MQMQKIEDIRNTLKIGATLTLRMRKTFRRYKEPARIPQIPGSMVLFQDDKNSCKVQMMNIKQSSIKKLIYK